jgi:ABC-type amino acid transport substrate-binding protein
MAASPRGVSGAHIQTEHNRAAALPLLAIWLVAVLFLGLTCGSMAGSASASTLSTTPPDLLVAANVYEPFVYYRDGQLVGFDVDLVNLIA